MTHPRGTILKFRRPDIRRYEVLLDVPRMGRVKHIIAADTATDARERAKLAHKSGKVISSDRMGAWEDVATTPRPMMQGDYLADLKAHRS